MFGVKNSLSRLRDLDKMCRMLMKDEYLHKRRLPSGQQSCGTTQQIHIIIPEKLAFLRVARWCQTGSHVLFACMLLPAARCQLL